MSIGTSAFDLQRAHTSPGTRTTAEDLTARVGRSTDGFLIDRLIQIQTTASGTNPTITVPDAVGPMILTIVMDTIGDDETAAVTTTTGADYAFTAAGDFCTIEWQGSTQGWVPLASIVT